MENSTLHNRANELNGRLKNLDRRLTRITDSCCGQAPELAEEGNAKSIDEHLHEKFDLTMRIICSMEDEMTRLENTVGSNQPLKSIGGGGEERVAGSRY